MNDILELGMEEIDFNGKQRAKLLRNFAIKYPEQTNRIISQSLSKNLPNFLRRQIIASRASESLRFQDMPLYIQELAQHLYKTDNKLFTKVKFQSPLVMINGPSADITTGRVILHKNATGYSSYIKETVSKDVGVTKFLTKELGRIPTEEDYGKFVFAHEYGHIKDFVHNPERQLSRLSLGSFPVNTEKSIKYQQVAYRKLPGENYADKIAIDIIKGSSNESVDLKIIQEIDKIQATNTNQVFSNKYKEELENNWARLFKSMEDDNPHNTKSVTNLLQQESQKIRIKQTTSKSESILIANKITPGSAGTRRKLGVYAGALGRALRK